MGPRPVVWLPGSGAAKSASVVYPAAHPLLVILGPTGSGKSALALSIANSAGGEIVNCDSVQVYRGFDIGTAKTSGHLVDISEAHDVFTAGDYQRLARATLDEIAARARLPVVVGGTGLYLRALLEGLFVGPRRDESLRERLAERERRKAGALHRLLRRLDPASAVRIEPRDVQKLLRALEVRLLTRRPLSGMLQEGRDALRGFQIVKIGLNPPREALYRRLDHRFAGMIEQGLLEEVRRLLENGVDPGAKPFESLGYKQALAVVRGEASLEEAIASAQRETRRYAKRQMTWFRREPGVRWLAGFGDDSQVRLEALDFVRQSFGLP